MIISKFKRRSEMFRFEIRFFWKPVCVYPNAIAAVLFAYGPRGRARGKGGEIRAGGWAERSS